MQLKDSVKKTVGIITNNKDLLGQKVAWRSGHSWLFLPILNLKRSILSQKLENVPFMLMSPMLSTCYRQRREAICMHYRTCTQHAWFIIMSFPFDGAQGIWFANPAGILFALQKCILSACTDDTFYFFSRKNT